MEFLFFIILGIILLVIFGDNKKQKAKPKPSSVLSPKQPRPILSPKSGMRPLLQANENQQNVWKNYEAAEQGEQGGMQDDLDPTAFYKISKDRIDLARKAASEKLSDSLQSFETTAKNKQASGAYVAKQPPLVRDMNLSRKLFLSGGRSNIFGERQKKSLGIKTILSVVGLAVIGLYLLGALGS